MSWDEVFETGDTTRWENYEVVYTDSERLWGGVLWTEI
jgi:hypothetical protein